MISRGKKTEQTIIAAEFRTGGKKNNKVLICLKGSVRGVHVWGWSGRRAAAACAPEGATGSDRMKPRIKHLDTTHGGLYVLI